MSAITRNSNASTRRLSRVGAISDWDCIDQASEYTVPRITLTLRLACNSPDDVIRITGAILAIEAATLSAWPRLHWQHLDLRIARHLRRLGKRLRSVRRLSCDKPIGTTLTLDEAGAREGQMGTDQPPLVGGKLVEKPQPG